MTENEAATFKGKVLAEVLAEVPPQTRIRVGSESGWIWLGKVSEASDMEKGLDAIRSEKQALCEKARKALEKKQSKESREKSLKSLKKNEEYLAKCIPLFKREVKDSYISFSGEALCLKVEGTENGRYWTYDEWKRRKERRINVVQNKEGNPGNTDR